MSARFILVISIYIVAAILGRLHSVTIPTWGWIVWGILLAFAIAAWFVVHRCVAFFVRKVVMLIPLSRTIETVSKDWNDVPVSEIESAITTIEHHIRRFLRFGLLQRLGIWAFRSQKAFFLISIVEHCKSQGSTVFDARMLATWLHGTMSNRLGEVAGSLISSGCQMVVVVLGALGIVFAGV